MTSDYKAIDYKTIDYKTIQYQVDNKILTLLLNRPEVMNAYTIEMCNELVHAFNRASDDDEVSVIVVTGAGKAFCAGLDMELMMSGGAPDLLERSHGVCNLFQQAAWVWHEVPVPVIAAVHGSCLGGGLQVMCGADMRYIHPQTKLSIMEMKWGLVPDMAGTQLWGAYVREDIIRELTYSARVFTGEEAECYGFATRLCEDPLADAMETAAQIAHKNPDAIRAAKRLINNQRQPDIAAGILAQSVAVI